MNERLNYEQQSPELFRKLVEWNMKVAAGAIEHSILDLVSIRASQINGCAFCLDMHVKQATLHGERPLRIYHLSTWRESTLFSPRERAALEWAEVLTRLPAHGVADEDYERVAAQLSEKEISDLAYAIAAINAWNRLNIGFACVPGSRDKQFGLNKSGLA